LARLTSVFYMDIMKAKVSMRDRPAPSFVGKEGTTMKPCLTYLRILNESQSGTGSRVVLEHSGFSEIPAKGSSLHISRGL